MASHTARTKCKTRSEIIAWLVMNDRKNEVPEYLEYYREYPAENPDNLFDLLSFPMSWNCQEILTGFVRDIYHEVRESPIIINGNEILFPLAATILAPFLDRGPGNYDVDALAEEVKNLGVPVSPDWKNPDFLKKHLKAILGNHKSWDLEGCTTRDKAISCYGDMTRSFMGRLAANKYLDWCAADYHRQRVLEYLVEALPRGKKPRELFPLAENTMDRLLVELTKKMPWLDSNRLFGLLNGIYWFMEFLEETGSLDRESTKKGRESCLRLFEKAYPAQRKQDFSARAWERFPRGA